MILVLLVVLLLVLGGGGGYYGSRRWGSSGGAGVGLGTILVVLLVAYMLGAFHYALHGLTSQRLENANV